LETDGGNYPLWLVLFNAMAIVLLDVVRNFLVNQGHLAGYQNYLNVRTALVGMVFEKMMRLSSSAQCSTPAGIITNYISVDIQHNKNFWYEMQFFVFCPLMVRSHSVVRAILFADFKRNLLPFNHHWLSEYCEWVFDSDRIYGF
jgi:hypothetical protein